MKEENKKEEMKNTQYQNQNVGHRSMMRITYSEMKIIFLLIGIFFLSMAVASLMFVMSQSKVKSAIWFCIGVIIGVIFVIFGLILLYLSSIKDHQQTEYMNYETGEVIVGIFIGIILGGIITVWLLPVY